MCGRSRSTLQRSDIHRVTGITPEAWRGDVERYRPVENAAPGSHLITVHQRQPGDGVQHVHVARWGLVPMYTKPDDKPDFYRMFNARSETVAEKPAFRRLMTSKRCIILVNGFYEWKKEKDGKQPYYIYDKDAPLLQLAGLWDVWHSADGPMETFTILTTDSAKRLNWLHDRQPVMLMTPEARNTWLKDGSISAEDLHKLCRPFNGDNLVWHPVTRAMNTAQYQGDDCAKEVKKSPGITAFFKPVAKKGAGDAGAHTKMLTPVKRPAADDATREEHATPEVHNKKVKQEMTKNSV